LDEYRQIPLSPLSISSVPVQSWRRKEIEKLFNECLELNNKRVQIAHGVWTEGLGDDWTVRHWSRQTLDTKHYPYGVDQLHADKAQALMQRVMRFKPKTP
jgi:hypothetical protein